MKFFNYDMNYIDFIRLNWKKFKRSPNLHQKIAGKIFMYFMYLIILIYVIGLPFIAFYAIKEQYKAADPFRLFHNYLFIFFFFVIYLRSVIPQPEFNPTPFMLLPVKKTKMIQYHLWRSFFSSSNLFIIISIIVYALILWYNAYNISGILSWATGMILSVYIISFLLFFLEKNQITNALLGLGFLFIILKFNWLTKFFQPYGTLFYSFYQKPLLVIIPLLILLLIITFIYTYLQANFYIDKTSSKKKKTLKKSNSFISNLPINGISGAIIKKDLKMIFRNIRPKQTLYSFVVMYIFAVLIYGGYLPERSFPTLTYSIFLAYFLTGFFVMGFGGFIPAWDSEYYSFLMSQNMTYKEYIKAKWNLMILSVLVALILTLPFIFFGKSVYLMLLAMAVFNAGINIPLVLFTGLLNTNPIRLNEKVKAFQNNESVNLKMILLGLLRIIIPVVIYYYVKQYLGEVYAVGVFVLMGISGIIFRNFLLNQIVKLYKKNKYKTIYKFQSQD